VAEDAPAVTIPGSPSRDLGIKIGRLPARPGPVRTGVTVILPHDGEMSEEPLPNGPIFWSLAVVGETWDGS
jgi:L-aminopeptidase/D-esterase-like protein